MINYSTTFSSGLAALCFGLVGEHLGRKIYEHPVAGAFCMVLGMGAIVWVLMYVGEASAFALSIASGIWVGLLVSIAILPFLGGWFQTFGAGALAGVSADQFSTERAGKAINETTGVMAKIIDGLLTTLQHELGFGALTRVDVARFVYVGAVTIVLSVVVGALMSSRGSQATNVAKFRSPN